MIEEWKDAVGFETLYEVSNYGKVRHADSKVEIGGSINSYGYRAFHLSKDGKRFTGKGHRLVAMAFIPNPSKYRCVNHMDGDKDNNSVDNLEWCTHEVNNKHARQELAIDFSKKFVVQTTMDGAFIAIWSSVNRAASTLGFGGTPITSCCLGTAYSAYGYCWKYIGI